MMARYSTADNACATLSLADGEAFSGYVGPTDIAISLDPVGWGADALRALVAGHGLVIGAYVPVSTRVVTYKHDLWDRCTDDEAATLDALLRSQPVRQQRLFNDAQVIDHADPLFTTLQAGIASVLGPSRAADLLAPSA